jgi:hypothetical protein
VTAYCASRDVPRAMIWFVAGLLREHRRALGTRKNTRILTAFRQAVFILAWMRDGGTSNGSVPASGCRGPPPTAATAKPWT